MPRPLGQDHISIAFDPTNSGKGKYMLNKAKVLLFHLVFWGISSPVIAQWTTQTIPLRAGWNAVFLEVEPEPNDCDKVFDAVPVESVWCWNRRFTPVQFIQEPNELVPGNPDWLMWFAPRHSLRSSRNLYKLLGHHSYLIKCAENTDWVVRGRPITRTPQWLPNSLNFVGFQVDANSPPTFQTFFAPSPAHAGKPAYRLNTAGRWERITSPAATTLRAGEAYWIQCDGPSTYGGPLSIMLEQQQGLHYRRALIEQPLKVINASDSAKTLTLRLLPSDPAPDGQASVAGPVPIYYYVMNLTNNGSGWVPLAGSLSKSNVGAGDQWVLRLEARRANMPQHSHGLYQSLLEVTDGSGSRLLIPVSSYPLCYCMPTISDEPAHAIATAQYSGLWVGNAVIEKVSQSNTNLPSWDTPVAAGSQFPIRLIVHVGTNGQPRLLRQALLVRQSEPRRTGVFTDETSLVSSWNVRRVSSAAFCHKNPEIMSGTFGAANGAVSCQVTLEYDAPLNPFKHRYHPEHDNLDPRFENVLTNQAESFDITRAITLNFGSGASGPQPGGNDSRLGGKYSEIVSGLHKHPLYISGNFELQRVSTIGTLNALSP